MRYPAWALLPFVLFAVISTMVIGVHQSSGQEPHLDPTVVASWEMITFSGDATVRRTKTPHGWLVITDLGNRSGALPVYIPDSGHTWLKSKTRSDK